MDDIISKIELLRRKHLECDDCWYSCPKALEGCCNDREGDECNCGAEDTNKAIDEIISLLRTRNVQKK